MVLDVAPGADFQTAANPAKWFVGAIGRLGTADRALAHRLLQAVRGDGLASQFQQFRGNYLIGFWIDLTSHGIPVLIPLWQKPYSGTSCFLG